jgi:hypothetical protein
MKHLRDSHYDGNFRRRLNLPRSRSHLDDLAEKFNQDNLFSVTSRAVNSMVFPSWQFCEGNIRQSLGSAMRGEINLSSNILLPKSKKSAQGVPGRIFSNTF